MSTKPDWSRQIPAAQATCEHCGDHIEWIHKRWVHIHDLPDGRGEVHTVWCQTTTAWPTPAENDRMIRMMEGPYA